MNSEITPLINGLDVPNNARSNSIVANTPSKSVMRGSLHFVLPLRRMYTSRGEVFSLMRFDMRRGRMARRRWARESPMAKKFGMVMVAMQR